MGGRHLSPHKWREALSARIARDSFPVEEVRRSFMAAFPNPGFR